MSAKTMKGKQAILRYLETHRTFTAKDVATECGMTINCITKNALDLERARKIVRVSKVWRTVTYRLATPEEQDGTARNCTNRIFKECRQSPAMKQLLAVYGRTSA
ncbi:protein ren [Klebsiella quasipneumoniae subsp. similipneumoniae]|nr:protein ren [Klebsiella quasipneumoniae subsp. similipneumoniae]